MDRFVLIKITESVVRSLRLYSDPWGGGRGEVFQDPPPSPLIIRSAFLCSSIDLEYVATYTADNTIIL